MSDSPSRLQLLRFLERVQVGDLERTRGWIAAEEQRLAEEAARRPLPPPPDWELQTDLRGRPMQIHTDGCRMGGKGWRMKGRW